MSDTLTARFVARPASPLIGAEIVGVDLTQPVDEATAEALREAFWTSELHGQLRLEAGRLRPLGQPGHLALRGQRLRRAPGVPQSDRRLAHLAPRGGWPGPWLGRPAGYPGTAGAATGSKGAEYR
jgi:hypothetical protein